MDRIVGRELPAGTVTLLFTDIEGSTRLLGEIGDLYGDLLAEHHRLLREVWSTHGGTEVDTEGDAFFVAFSDARAAVRAAAAAQEALASHVWPHGGAVGVRMGVHSGAPQIRDGTYWGTDVHYAARLCAAAHGGQVLLSASTRALADDVPAEDLGEHAVKDFPSPRRLYHLVVAGRGSGDFLAPRTLATVRTNLPSVAASLVGRERELADVCAQLADGVRVLTVTGVGGSGKTRLALAAGAELLDAFPDGVFLASLASIADEDRVPLAIGRAIGAQIEDGRDPVPALVGHLARRRLLLILDNMEHLLGAAPLASRLVESAPALRVLATSQAPLRVQGEVVMPLESLELPAAEEQDPAALEAAASVALFVERARAANPAFAFTADQAPAVAELCRRLDGLPLALELAAARVRLGGPQRLLAALERGLDALGSGARDVPERQRGLRAALDWTVSLLREDERLVFAGLGAFAEAWTMEQLERMFGDELDVWEASASLLDFSLIRTRGDGRFTMAETVRAYARGLLEERGRAGECRARHAELLAEEAEAIHDNIMLDTGLVARTIDLLREFSVALEWSAAHDPRTHRRLVGALGWPYWYANRLSVLADEILALCDADADTADDVSSRLLIGKSNVLSDEGDTEGATEAMAAAAEVYRRLGDERGQAVALGCAAHLLWFAGSDDSVARARGFLDAALALPAARADRRVHDFLEGEVAMSLLAERSLDEAEQMITAIVAQPGRTDLASMFAMSSWADCAFLRGQHADALERYAEMLRRLGTSQIGNALLQCYGIATALAGLGRDREAVEMVAAAKALAEAEVRMDLPDDFLPEGGDVLRASRARIGAAAVAEATRRGRERNLDDLVSWALSLATPTPAGAA